ncbi:MAG: fibronectin type III domain-containing protein [Paludibacteraceae bacterium]|nr:fibronectin type III domain-containing protein [Paludibacteraceae bacterium]
MKNIFLLSNPAKTSTHFRFDSLSILSRQSVLPIILLCLAFSVSVWGEPYTLDGLSTPEAAVADGFTFSTGGTGTTPAWNSGSSELRIYANDYFEIDGGTQTITEIVYTLKQNQGGSGSGKAYPTGYTMNTGSASFTSGSQGSQQELTWTGSASTVRITVNGAKGNYGFKSVSITTSGGASYTITPATSDGDMGTVSLTGSVITASPKSGYQVKESDPYTVTDGSATVTRGTGANINKFTVAPTSDCTVRINFEAIPTYDIRFFNNGTQVGSTQNLPAGATAVKPSDPAACDEGYTFVGWWTGELAEDNTTAETWITDFTVSGAQDYYAVFKHNEGATGDIYSKTPSGSSDLVSGGSGTYYTLTIATGVTVTISDWDSNVPIYHSDGQWRIYTGSSVVIASTLGNITKIEFTSTQNNLSTSQGTYSDQTWTGDASSVTFSAGAQSRITRITVTVGDPGTTYYTTDCGSACSTPTLTLSNGGATVNKFVGDANFTITATPSNTTLPGGTVTYSSSLPSKASVDPATGEVTIHDAMSTTPVVITATLGKVTSGTECQKQVKASYTLNIYNRVTWLVNGAPYTEGDPTQQAAEGGTITAYPTDPDGATACGGKTFVGWTDAPYAESDAAPDPLYTSLSSMSSVHITENTTFHAVFAESGGGSDEIFKKGTSADLEDGQTVIIVNAANNKALSSAATASELSLVATDVSISSDQITNPASSLKWTVVDNSGNYQFMNGGNYLWAGKSSGTYTLNCSGDYDDTWSVVTSGDHYIVNSDYYSGYKLEYYATNDEFTIYNGSGNQYLMDFYFPYTSYSAYSTTCGPNIKANEVEYLTSTKDQTVKSQAITIKGSSLTGGTLSVKSITGDASQFACVLASQTITAGAIETTYTISYIPTVYGATHTAEIIFWDGTTESDPITLRGRSLPEHFAIVAYDGANYYALDGSMSGTASTVRAIPVTVTAGVVDYCPSRGIYSLTDLDTPDQNIHLTSATGRLYGEGSGTGLNIHSFTSLSGTGWLLTTTDFVNYHVTNATTATRGIMYNSTYDVMGHYITTNYGKANYFGEIQFLPYADVCTCLDALQHVTVVAKATRATITWDEVADATGYDVTCVNASTSATEGSISIDAVNRTATITGLTNLTNYNFTVKAIASGNDCSLAHAGHFRTTNCDDVPYGIRVTPAINSATFKWSMEAASATIQIFSDEECTSQVGSDHTGLTSPATITGLNDNDNRQYYAKILAGGTCESGVIDFQTNSPSVEIAEWFPDSIRIIIDANADASVIIEDKQEHGSTTVNYADKLFISKYFEADGNNKMIAIFNGTPDTIDITKMWLYRSELGAAEKKICLKNFGKVPGKIAPNEEIIIMRYTSDSDPAENCAEKEDNYDEWNIIKNGDKDGEGNDIYTWLQFSGPQSIGLYDNNTGVKKFIDVIGATTNASGTGELVQIKASNKTHCTHTENSNNDGSGFFADGKDIRDGRDVVLSTNRCLLIRKNTVKSGDDAVANNVYATQEACDASIGHAFTTLGDEWLGFIIGAGPHAADSTCEGLAFVGGFDYNGYYTTYDSIGGIKDLTGKQNDDGTYTIPIPQLDTLSCSTMRIKVYEGTEVKAQHEYQVPIMVDTDKEWKTTDTIFQNKWHDLETCKTCDVVILKGATLTKAENGLPKDAATVGNLTIYPGGTMNIPTSRTFNVASVQFRVEGENVPFIKLAGTLQTADQQVLVSRRINNSEAYFFSLPYDCNISDIRWSNGEPAVLDDGFRIKEYDSRARADEGSAKGAPGHWKMVTGSTLEAGKGYQISVNNRYLRELIFPLEIHTTNVSDAENEKATNHDNDVAIHQYTNGATTINNHNWNFIAQPYLCAMSPMAGDAITYGYLEYEIEEVAGEQQVVWYRRMEGNQYLTIYNPSTKTYDQIFWNSVSQLDPFLAFFVQGKTEGSFTFTEGNRKNSAPARHLASQAEVDDDPSIFVGVTLSGNGLTDQANLRVRQDFTEDEYKLGYDLLKFTTYYKDRPQVYMKTPSYQLAFQAVSDSVAKNTWLPMGVYCYKPGTYTFGLSNDYPIDEVEAVYLYDKVAGVTTNLLYDTYTITTSSQLYTNTRFALNVIVNRRAPQVTTDIGIPEAPDNMARKILINGHVYIQRGAAIYDITGKQMLNF